VNEEGKKDLIVIKSTVKFFRYRRLCLI